MPLYEYECTACHKRTEKIQKFSDPEITECPKCGGPLERVVSAPAIAFKGGGWYADGYGNAKPSANATSDSSASSGDTAAKPSGDAAGKSSAPATTAPAAAPSTAPAASSSTSSKSE